MDGLGRWVLLLGVLVAGCATSPQQAAAPQIQRISAQELERLLPRPEPSLTYQDLVRLAREGATPETMIEQIRQSNSSYALTPSQALELGKQGVDAKVLDYMHAAREQAMRDGFADELNRREREHQAEMESLQRQCLMRPCPYDALWGAYPSYWYYPYYRR